MVYHDDAVSRQVHVELNGIGELAECLPEAGQGVFRVRARRPAVRNDLWPNRSRGRCMRWRGAGHAAKLGIPPRSRNREPQRELAVAVLNRGQRNVINKWQ
jgi:hypothetical protein